MTSTNDNASLQKTLIFIFMLKIVFIPHLFFEIIQRYCKLIFGTLDMPSHVYHKRWYHLEGNSDVYSQTKNQLNPFNFSTDTAL